MYKLSRLLKLKQIMPPFDLRPEGYEREHRLYSPGIQESKLHNEWERFDTLVAMKRQLSLDPTLIDDLLEERV